MRGADSPGRILGVNICADCDNACGGCSWSERDPETNKMCMYEAWDWFERQEGQG